MKKFSKRIIACVLTAVLLTSTGCVSVIDQLSSALNASSKPQSDAESSAPVSSAPEFSEISSKPEESSEQESVPEKASEAYLAGEEPKITLYELNGSLMQESCALVRGTAVMDQHVLWEGSTLLHEYEEIELDGKTYYVDPEELSVDPDNVVLEKTVYVRTPCTTYVGHTTPEISGYLKKGTALSVMTYDYMQDDGVVHMYKVKQDGSDLAFWVFGKYLMADERKANAFYNGNDTFLTHYGRVYEEFDLLGGEPGLLDYFPVEKPSFPDNPLMKEAKAMYLDGESIYLVDDYIEIAKASGINTIVLDIKDGYLAYQASTAYELSPTSFENAYAPAADYQYAVQRLLNAGLYVVGRIVVFNDPAFGADHPEACIDTPESDEVWLSAFSRECWEYNVRLALESIEKMGFNEIQFDYVRFPDYAYDMTVNPATDFKNKYDESKSEAIQGFLFYACDMIHKQNVYVSVDVFGDATHPYTTPQGQYWPAISNVVDVISAMPYVDHFYVEGDTWTNPYNIVHTWALTAYQRQTETPTPAIARTWITGYDTPYWDPTVEYGAEKMEEQAWALYDADLTGGFIPWNAAASRWKYWQMSDFWKIDYKTDEQKAHDPFEIDPSIYDLSEDDYYVPYEHPEDAPAGNGEGEGGSESIYTNPHQHQTSSNTNPDNFKVYTVEEGDTYYGLLIDFYDTFSYDLLEAFCDYNEVDPDVMHVGDELKIPPIDFFNLD